MNTPLPLLPAVEVHVRPMRVVIADDERLARDALRILLERVPDTCIVAECADGRSAIAAVEREAPDALFLDIEMPGFSGFDVLERVSPGRVPSVVFVTAHHEYAVHAFDIHAADYILKPLRQDRVAAAAERARQHMQRRVFENVQPGPAQPQAPAPEHYCTRIMVRTGAKSYFVELSDVQWIEARGNYVCLHVDGGSRHVVRSNIGDLAERLDPVEFLRIHRSTIVNVRRIDHVRPYGGSDYEVVLAGGEVLRVARSCRDRLLRVYH